MNIPFADFEKFDIRVGAIMKGEFFPSMGGFLPSPLHRGPSRLWGSGSHGQAGGGIGFGLEQVAESGAELTVDDGAADLEQEIGAAAGPAHLLLLVHAPVDQEVGGAFGDRGADPLTGMMTLGVVDQPGTLAGQIGETP